MKTDEEKQLEQVTEIFSRLGAGAEQSRVMARQLMKRSKQISVQRDISEVEALETLLKQVVEARQGL
jgi:hypothetical protein